MTRRRLTDGQSGFRAVSTHALPEAEIAHALKVMGAAGDAERRGLGAYTVDGKMIDGPFVRRAEAVVALARQLGLPDPQVSLIRRAAPPLRRDACLAPGSRRPTRCPGG